MSGDEILLDVEERMEKAVGVLAAGWPAFAPAGPTRDWSIRSGSRSTARPRPSSKWLPWPPEPNQIVIRPYDPGTLKDIEKAIQASDLGFNPQNDGRIIRLSVPPLSTEVRRKMVGRVRELVEETKVAIRNVRRDGNKMADQSEKDKDLSEDDRDQVKEQIQDLTKQYENQAAEMAKAREKEVMENWRMRERSCRCGKLA